MGFSKLHVHVMPHDLVESMVGMGVMTLIKYDEWESTYAANLFTHQGIKEDLSCHNQYLSPRCKQLK